MLTQAQLKSVLNYDQDTGIFTWLVKISKKIKIGDIAGSKANGYKIIRLNNKQYYAHRLAWLYIAGEWPKNEIDHINNIKIDNRIKNLRDVSSSKNKQNKIKAQKNSTSGFLGVSWHKAKNKWRARIRVNKKELVLGYFDDKEIAYQTYLNAKRKYHEGCTI